MHIVVAIYFCVAPVRQKGVAPVRQKDATHFVVDFQAGQAAQIEKAASMHSRNAPEDIELHPGALRAAILSTRWKAADHDFFSIGLSQNACTIRRLKGLDEQFDGASGRAM